MKELQDILAAAQKLEKSDQKVALATVVQVSGSVYRRPGARMLMTEEGSMLGAISGGCLEADVFEHAQTVMTTGQAVTITYDTTSDGDIVWGLGLGCNGKVHVLIESLPKAVSQNVLSVLAMSLHQSQRVAIATIFQVKELQDVAVGSRLMCGQDGTLMIQTVSNSQLSAAIQKDLLEAFHTGKSHGNTYRLPQGQAEVLIEIIDPPLPLVIFGAGHDAIPLVRFARELGWHITVVDHRPTFATPERFPQADQILCCLPERLSQSLSFSSRSVAVVMTHNFNRDRELLPVLLPSETAYIGVLGPKRRTEKLLQELRDAGINPTDAQLRRVFGPIGIDIGAETPEEIALSILAEIRAVLSRHHGGFLREKDGPIH